MRLQIQVLGDSSNLKINSGNLSEVTQISGGHYGKNSGPAMSLTEMGGDGRLRKSLHGSKATKSFSGRFFFTLCCPSQLERTQQSMITCSDEVRTDRCGSQRPIRCGTMRRNGASIRPRTRFCYGLTRRPLKSLSRNSRSADVARRSWAPQRTGKPRDAIERFCQR
jgi:hypothetical protein